MEYEWNHGYTGPNTTSNFTSALPLTTQENSIATTDLPDSRGNVRKFPQRLIQILNSLKRECRRKMQGGASDVVDGLYCPREVDRLGGCWPDTPAGSVAVIPCPPIPAFDVTAHAYRECTENGTWFTNSTIPMRRINYTMCIAKEDLFEGDTKYVYIFIGGFSLSLVMLILSLAIFFRFRQLRCERITIHKNLFLSYVFTGVSWILFYSTVALNGDVLLRNPVWCRCLHVICHYFTVCNFSWMFCEGLYINTIMAYAFSMGKKLVKLCYFIGWVCPALLASIYAAVRNNKPLITYDCWIDESKLQWILFGPVVLSIAVNAIFLINIIRLLITKLRQMPDAAQTKKATRATLILVPLLGLQFLLMPMRPDPGSAFDEAYHIATALILSTQGAFVSLVYCFCNGEVITVLRRKYRQHRLMHKRSSKSSSSHVPGYTVTDNVPLHHNGNIHQSKTDETEKTPLEAQSANDTV